MLACALLACMPAHAEQPVGRTGCGVATGLDAGLDAALARLDRAACPAPGTLAGPRQWTVIDFAEPLTASAPPLLQTKFARFDAIALHVQHADGSWSHRRWGGDVAQRRWLAGGLFTLPIASEDAPVRRIAVSVDKADSADPLTNLALVPADTMAKRQFHASLLFALLCGLVTVPIFYNLAFLAVLRERFMYWHIAMSSCILVYTAASSGLIVEIFPGISLGARAEILHLGFTCSIAAGAVFLSYYIEGSGLSRAMRLALRGCALWAVVVAALLAFYPFRVPADADLLHDTGLGLVLLVCVAAIAQALRRGSRAGRFLAAGWSLIILGAIDRLARAFGLYEAPAWVNDALFFGLAFETVVTALGVTDRFLAIRRERDHARERAEMMERLADTDPLTGIGNRRALERRYRATRPGALALVDLDLFKQVNDRHGHDVGDRVLRSTARALDSMRPHAAARLGGEEFALLLYGPGAAAAAARLRRAITARVAQDVPGLGRPLTASMGLIHLSGGESFSAACKAADTLLYRAKSAGRNRLVDNRAAAATTAARDTAAA